MPGTSNVFKVRFTRESMELSLICAFVYIKEKTKNRIAIFFFILNNLELKVSKKIIKNGSIYLKYISALKNININ